MVEINLTSEFKNSEAFLSKNLAILNSDFLSDFLPQFIKKHILLCVMTERA